jgi:SAM-dependent methyltransferase
MAVSARRADRARERQLEYMRKFAEAYRGREHEMIADMRAQAADVRSRIDVIRPMRPSDHVLEVGSGGCGLIFNFGGEHVTGVDPLADHLRQLFPWQRASDVPTLRAEGENLPFETGAFDIVLSDNVVDHARDPRRILEEIARVLKPGGLLYFTVHVHHPIYDFSSKLYGAWRAVGLPGEITPLADHTVHLTLRAAHELFRGLPLRIVQESTDLDQVREDARRKPPRHARDRLKRLFFKNATWEVFALRT